MGALKYTPEGGFSASCRRLGWRSCLRKGCGRRYRAQHPKQRYCQQPDCLREVRRWQATKRQQKRRASAEGRQQHAQAERERRARQKRAPSSLGKASAGPEEPARGHAKGRPAKKSLPGRSVIGPAAMSLPALRHAPGRPTVARSATGRCAVCTIASANGCRVSGKRSASSVVRNTKWPAKNAGKPAPLATTPFLGAPIPAHRILCSLRSAAMALRSSTS